MCSTPRGLQFTFKKNLAAKVGERGRAPPDFPGLNERMKRDAVPTPTSRPGAARSAPADPPKTDLCYWKSRLVHRKYIDLIDPAAARQYSARIGHVGTSCYFPLGSEDETHAAARALEIDRVIEVQGWDFACKRYPREFTLAIFWSDNPLLCTYSTLLTAPRKGSGAQPTPLTTLPDKIRVALVERDEEVRRALAAWSGRTCAGAFADSKEACSKLSRKNADLLLFDRSQADLRPGQPPGEGQVPPPDLPTFAFGIYETSDDIFISHTGVRNGYFLRRTPPADLLGPLRGAWVEGPPNFQSVLVQARKYFQGLVGTPPPGDEAQERTSLTPREEEILLRLSKGYPDKQIAGALKISTWTVHNHMKNIFRKLGVHTRTQAVIKYLQR